MRRNKPKHLFLFLMPYLPWLLLLLAVGLFAALLLWIADVQAFYAMSAAIMLAGTGLFAAVSYVLIRLEQKKEQAFYEFLKQPDEYHEELLQKAVGPAYQEPVRQLGSCLREKSKAQIRMQEKICDYEEYVEAWAHEIKTPLSLLTLLLDNRREELPAGMEYKLDHIRNRMQESVSQMLFYARLKGARKDYQFEHIRIRTCIEELLDDYRPLLEEKEFQIRCSLADDTVYADRRGLCFLLGQIISNSVKYCSGQPELYIASFMEKDHYVLSVRDNGIGVRSCDLPYIFEKGFTGDSGEERKKATGMGLYLAGEVAKEMGVCLRIGTEWRDGLEMQAVFPVVRQYNGKASAQNRNFA